MSKNKVVTWTIVLVTVLAMIGFSGLFNLGPSNPSSNQGGQQTESDHRSVPCLASEAFHIHPQLTVLVDGKEESVPANIGILPGCTRELHTHATDGVIHVESAVDRGYTFADLLSVWQKPLLREGYTLRITVDGKETTEPNFILKDNQQIILEYSSSSQ